MRYAALLIISNFTVSELAEYEAAMMNKYDYKATIDYAEKRGVEKGIFQTARAMLAESMSLDLIAKIAPTSCHR
jgi:hypothetical protein